MNLAHWLDRTATLLPDKPAVFLGRDPVMTYGDLLDQVRRVAGGLVARGIKPGDRVAIFMKNQPEYLVVEYAIWLMGAAIVPINAKLHAKEVEWILENAGAALLFTSPGLTEGITADLIEVGSAAYSDLLAAAPFDGVAQKDPGDLA